MSYFIPAVLLLHSSVKLSKCRFAQALNNEGPDSCRCIAKGRLTGLEAPAADNLKAGVEP
jgi:hypothetical protein